MPEEERKAAAPESEAEGTAVTADQLAEIIQGLLDEGLSAEQTLEVVAKAVEAGELPEEAIEIAKELIAADDRKGAELFGVPTEDEEEGE